MTASLGFTTKKTGSTTTVTTTGGTTTVGAGSIFLVPGLSCLQNLYSKYLLL